MPKQIYYNAAEHISAETAADPYLRPAFSLGNRMRRLVWNLCWALFYRMTPRIFHPWRSFLLRCFGATLGPRCHFYPRIESLGALEFDLRGSGDGGDGAEIYNPAPGHAGLACDPLAECLRLRGDA